MTDLFVPGEISGKNYRIKIKGETPTADERQQIDAFVRQKELEFAEQYQERFGASALPSRGLGAQVSEFFRGIPRGGGGLFEISALGGVSPLEADTEDRFREGIRSVGMNLQDRYAPPIGREDMVGGRLGEAVGSMGAIAGAAGAAGLATGNPLVGFGTGLALGASAGAGEARERARAAGATREEMNLATQFGVAPGALEVVPIIRLNRVLERGGFRERLQRALLTGGEEGLQEAASGVAQNLIEQGVYNPERGTFEGTGEDLGYGAGAGALVQAITDLVLPGRLRARSSDMTPPEPPGAVDDPVPTPTAPAAPEALADAASPGQPAAAPAQAAPASGITTNPVVADARGYFEERAAVVEESTGMSRERSEAQAAQETIRYLETTGQIENPVLRPLLRSLRQRADTIQSVEADTGPPTPPLEAYADIYQTTGQRELALEARAETPAPTQEAQDAQTAQSGPDQPVTARDRDGAESRVEEPRAGDVTSDTDTTRAEPPVGRAVGEPVLGARGPDTPEGAEPSALIGEPDAATGTMIEADPLAADPPALDIEAAPTAETVPETTAVAEAPTSAAAVTESAPDGGIAALPEGVQQAAPEQAFDRNVIPGRTTGAAEQIIPSPEMRDPPARPDPEAAVRVEQEAAAEARRAPTTQGGMTRVMDEIGVGPEARLRKQVRSGEMQTPEQFVEGLAKTQFPKNPEGKTRRDNWLEGAREQAREDAVARQSDPAVDAVTRQIVEAQEREQATRAIEDWFDRNASEDLKAADKENTQGGRESTPLASVDLRAVSALLATTPALKSGEKLTDAQAAQRYFGRTADAGYALHMIAHDAAQANVSKGKRIPKILTRDSILGKDRNFETEPLETGERESLALLEGHGWDTGQRAARWVEKNLSPEGVGALVALRDRPATSTTAGYSNLDYGQRTRSDRRDRDIKNERRIREMEKEAELQQRRSEREDVAETEAIRAAVDESPITLPPAPWDVSASLMTWPADAHPRVGALLRAGRLSDAIRVLAATAPNETMRDLAGRMASRLEGTPTQIVSPETMNRIRAEMSPETPTLGVESPAGVYVHPRNAEQIAAMRREGHDEAASIAEEFGGQILFNENTSLAPELVIHEAAHAVGDAVLSNKSHPLTRQLDKLRTELLKFMPATNYGLSNVREFFAEGMSNPAFRRELSYATAEGRPISAWEQFKNIVRNWLRSFIGLNRKPIDTTLDALDRALDGVLAVNPNEMNAGDMLNASFAPGGVERMVKSMQDRVVPMNSWARNRIERFMEDPAVPNRVKSAFAYFGQGVQFTAENAQKLLPSSTQILDLLRQHKGASDQMSNLIRRSIEPFANVMAKYDGRSDITNAVARVSQRGSAEGVDVINQPLSHYQGYSFRYNVMDADGNVVRSVESKRYKTERERNQALQDYNAKLPPDAPKVARARRGYDSSPEDVALYRALERDKRLLQRDAPDVIGELKRMQAVPESLRGRLADALRARIEAMAPNNREQQNKIFNRFYSKITAESLIDYYFALSRQGNHWVTYTGYDADTGQVATFKHSFPSLNEQQRALQMLQKQNERYYARAQQLMGDQRPVNEFQASVERGGESIPTAVADQLIQENVLPATEVFSYVQNPSDPRVRPPTEMMGRIFETLEGMSDTATITDPETGRTVDIRDQIVDLFLDSMPESSFLNTFRKRAGTRGFENDITYLQDTVTAGDLSKNFMQNNMRLANQIVSMEYGAKFSGYRNKIREELGTLENRLPATDDLQQRARKKDAAQGYYNALIEHSMAPFRVTGNLASSAVGVTYALSLGFNVSTAVLTTMSLPIFYAPYAGGKYGYGKLIGAMGKASRIIAGSGREKQAMRIGRDGQLEPVTEQRPFWDITINNIDYSQPQFAWMRDAHKFWEDRGMFLNSPIMSELLGENPNLIQKITSKSAIFQHLAERAVRENALVSTYIMELQNQMGDTRSDVNAFIADLESGVLQPTAEQANAAASEALTMSEKTNGPMLAAMGPRASISDFGRVVYLFKRHPLAMMNNMFQTVNRSFGPDSPDRAIARRQLTGMLGMLGLTSGIMGLPMMQQVAMLFDYFLIEDDEPDFVSQLRMTTGELGTYGALDYLLGLRNSERIGLGGAIYREGFQSSGLPPLFQLAEGFGGPVVGLALKYSSPRTREHFAEGRYGRFMEQVLPSSMANFFRAYRYQSEGIQNLRGDIVVDDIGPFHIAAQALGFMPASYAQRLAINSLGSRINNAIEGKVQHLMRKRNKAIFEGDMETVREVTKEIDEFRRRHPGRIDRGTLESSLRAFNDRTQKTNYGLMVAPRNKAYIDSILNDIGSPSIWN